MQDTLQDNTNRSQRVCQKSNLTRSARRAGTYESHIDHPRDLRHILETKHELRHKLNSKCQYKKHELEGSRTSTGLANLKAELNKLKKRVDGMEKSLTEPPFTKDILEAPLPVKFKMPQLELYGGERDLIEHLETFRSCMELQGVT